MNTITQTVRPERGALRKQGGVVLVITLIMLVAMTLAAISLVRSIDTTTLITGNLAFKQSATYSGNAGVETAIAWLTSPGASLEQDQVANGYYATSQDSLDLTGNKTPGDASDDLNWAGSNVRTLTIDSAGNTVAYVIHRMCDAAGPLDGATCATEQDAQGGSSQGGNREMQTYQPGTWSMVANRAFYRITVHVSGPRKNVGYVQVFVSM